MNGAASGAGSRGHLSFGVAAGFVLVAVIVAVLAVITDLSCFFVNRCGITMCICHSLGRSPGPLTSSQSREKALEEGERYVTICSHFEPLTYLIFVCSLLFHILHLHFSQFIRPPRRRTSTKLIKSSDLLIRISWIITFYCFHAVG